MGAAMGREANATSCRVLPAFPTANWHISDALVGERLSIHRSGRDARRSPRWPWSGGLGGDLRGLGSPGWPFRLAWTDGNPGWKRGLVRAFVRPARPTGPGALAALPGTVAARIASMEHARRVMLGGASGSGMLDTQSTRVEHCLGFRMMFRGEARRTVGEMCAACCSRRPGGALAGAEASVRRLGLPVRDDRIVRIANAREFEPCLPPPVS
jgi:hypothetical protein